jgi:hypothetical protein
LHVKFDGAAIASGRASRQHNWVLGAGVVVADGVDHTGVGALVVVVCTVAKRDKRAGNFIFTFVIPLRLRVAFPGERRDLGPSVHMHAIHVYPRASSSRLAMRIADL